MKKYIFILVSVIAVIIITITLWPYETFVDLTEVESLSENVETYQLTYHSDGYLIDGFMIRPKSENS